MVFEGLEELKDALRSAPEAIAAQAGPIVQEIAAAAAADVRQQYPSKTGTLRGRVRTAAGPPGRFGARWVVQTAAPHALIYERGTTDRHTRTGAYRGRMPAARVFVPAMIRWRTTMYARLAAMLQAFGFEVGGA